MRPSYRHSVWIDVLGIVLFGAVLLGGAGYLLYHAGGAASGLGGGAVATSGGEGSVPEGLGPRHTAQRPAPSSRSNPLFGGGRAPAQSGSGVEAPFSESWQEEATPDLTGPSSGAPGAPSGGGASAGDEGPEPGGAAIASRGRTGSGGPARAERGSGGWRAEARRFSGRARALSNQLGQMARSGPEEQTKSTREDAPATTSAGRTSSSASSDPGTPGDPSQVPIGGLEWLAAAGALYALRRLGLRSET